MARLLAVFDLSYRAQEGAIVALLVVIALLLVVVLRGQRHGRQPVARAPERPPAPAHAAVPDHLPVLIAAAVHMALEGLRHRILHIEPASSDWATEGRRDIFSSHRIR